MIKLLLLGATGLAGQALRREAQGRALQLRTAARKGADVDCDIGDAKQFEEVLAQEAPDVVVNAVGLVNLGLCSSDPGMCWRINGRPAGLSAEWSLRTGHPFIQISTDHFFVDGGSRPHSEGRLHEEG